MGLGKSAFVNETQAKKIRLQRRFFTRNHERKEATMAPTSTTTMGDEARNGESPPQSSAELDAFVEDMLEQMVCRMILDPYSLLRSVPFTFIIMQKQNSLSSFIAHCALLHPIHASSFVHSFFYLLRHALNYPYDTANSFQRHGKFHSRENG
jgi:hypothetical protein